MHGYLHTRAADSIHCSEIVTQEDGVQFSCSSCQWSIAFHADYAIHNCKPRFDRGNEINYRKIYSFYMQNIFWPAILSSWYNTEHIFHRTCKQSPVMRLQLRNRNDKIC